MTDYRINPMPEPLSPELIQKLRLVQTASVGHFRQWGFMDRRIRPLLRGKRVAGVAVTVAIPGPDSTLLGHALGLLRPGDFVVVDRLGDDRYACWGGGVTASAKAAGAVGAIVDGPCTDLLEIEEADFPMWCRGLSSITAGWYNLGGTMNHPVACGNVPVLAGDVILADEEGVVILPREEANEIADSAIALQDLEKATRLETPAGETSEATQMVLEAIGQKS
ncbi:RraA family protein [Mesorhizobium sp.]|uniref:RraA family protein n=1 Tax=Mesorhizobium sp. TaxID=1871066 RepID=UPI000FE973F6|nr:RraA family protein [Mesorhizobium sp.]RWI85983.1 MAG: RraA family protein [Mesorhizobium sp.]